MNHVLEAHTKKRLTTFSIFASHRASYNILSSVFGGRAIMGIQSKSAAGGSSSNHLQHPGSHKRLNILHHHNPGLAGSEFDLDLCTVVLVGDAKVGKTALINRLVNDSFSQVGKRTCLGYRHLCVTLRI